MEAYHNMLVHFPLALLTTAVLVIVLRVFSPSPFAQACDRVLAPLIGWGVATGVLAYGVGLLVWPLEAVTATPLGRNHILVASWTLAYWALLGVSRWRLGVEIWDGANRWLMLLLAALGGGLLTVTGTLGGHLAGAATAVSKILRAFGWEVYTTFYVPNLMLILLVLAALAMAAVGLAGRQRR